MISTLRLPRRRSRMIAIGLSVGLGTTALVGIVPSAQPAALASAALQGLSIGSTGTAVADLQEALLAHGIDVVGGADGVFGPRTLEALQAFQQRSRLPVTESVSEVTLVARGLVDSPAVGLAEGARGETVVAVQQALIAAGLSPKGGADGIFGPATAAALRSWQSTAGLEATGTVDELTAARLLNAGSPVLVDTPSATDDSSGEMSADTPEPTVAADDSRIGLAYGDWGADVESVQELLIAAGVDLRGGADGLFGAATRDAVNGFQVAAGLSATGRVDAATLAALLVDQGAPLAAAASHPYTQLVGLRPGALGESVVTLQQRLLDLGVRVRGGADGVFGPATAEAVRAFQDARGLNVDGIVDDATAAALAVSNADATNDDVVSDGRTGWAVYGERGSRVVAAQQALVDAGVRVRGGVDGVFGSATAAAVMDFQRTQGLRVTGVIDAATADVLGLAASAVPADSPVAAASIDVFPVQGRCGYSDTWHAPRSGGRLHLGVDIIAAEGNLIYAVTDGVITKVYEDRPGSLSGNGIRLTTEDGTYFFYAHFTHVAEGIVVGAEVKAGQVVGYNGSTGNSSAPHLHFEVHPQGGAAVNPYPIVKAVDACHITEPLVLGEASTVAAEDATVSSVADSEASATVSTDNALSSDEALAAAIDEFAAEHADHDHSGEGVADDDSAIEDDFLAADHVDGVGPDDAAPTGA